MTPASSTKKKKRNPSGAGSWRKTPHGTWRYAITVGRQPNGKPLVKYFYGKTQREARTKAEQYPILPVIFCLTKTGAGSQRSGSPVWLLCFSLLSGVAVEEQHSLRTGAESRGFHGDVTESLGDPLIGGPGQGIGVIPGGAEVVFCAKQIIFI